MTRSIATPTAGDGRALLAWYDRHARKLPWRAPPGARQQPDPYRVWLSEIMLQQTTVAAVIPYFHAFLERWPTIGDLAAAPQDEVMKLWAGLGYYSRARNLKRCAEMIGVERGGAFPRTVAGLQALPGVGLYTAAAIAAIAFREPVPVIDGNVERVAARLLALGAPPKAERGRIRDLLMTILPRDRPGDFAQALMDLGATVCTPRRPACTLCPLRRCCAASATDPASFPVTPARRDRPLRRGAAFVAVRSDGAILLRRRPPSGLLGAMAEVPTSDWSAGFRRGDAPAWAPLDLGWQRLPEKAAHGFTHFLLELDVYRGDAPPGAAAPPASWWSAADALAGEALPTVMRKVIAIACPQLHLSRRS